MKKSRENLKNRRFSKKVEKVRKTRFFEKTAFFVFFALFWGEFAAFAVDFRRAETLEDAHAASCRITAGGSRGTGTFIGEKDGVAYILTCCHVVGQVETVTLDFWGNYDKQALTAKTVWRAYDVNLPADFSFIALNAQQLKETVDPPFVPLGGADAKPTPGGYIVSSGAPDGRFVQAWKGRVIEYYQDATALFSPPPVPGQSGSAIIEKIDGELFITGVLTWLIGEKGRDDSRGGAIPVANIYKAAKRGKRAPTALENSASPIPPNASECSDAIDAVNRIIDETTVFFYTSKNCAGCKSVEEDVRRLENENYHVERIETTTPEGYEIAKNDGVEKIPCIGIEKGTTEIELIEAEEILEKGLYAAVVERTPKKDIRPAPEKKEETFRTRAPVLEDNNAITGILGDSENRWIGRGRRDGGNAEPNKEQPEKETPKPSILPNNDGQKLGDRIADRIADALSRKLENEASKLGTKIEGEITARLDGYKDQIESAIIGAINEKIKSVWSIVKSIFLTVAGVVVVGWFIWRRKEKV